MIRPLFSLFLLLAFALVARAELVVRNPVVGFGGAVVPERFNLVSVEVQNAGAKPWEGVISLGDDGGVPYEQALFLSPGASRWVQFLPYISGFQTWRIQWLEKGGRGDSMKLIREDESMKTGGPVTVILNAPDSPRVDHSRLRPFFENLFPPSVTGTESLYGVVLDHVPRWDAVRKQAFRDWVYRGGTVYLIHGVDGKFPEFSEELEFLNAAKDQEPYGAGKVRRIASPRSELEPSKLESEPKLQSDGSSSVYDPGGMMVRRLSDITRPKIPWGLIYFLTIVYVVVIGPVFYALRKRDYRMMLGVFIATVAAFAWLFTVVGRRGYGEKQLLHAVGFAESLGGNRFASTHWFHAFATSSGNYRFQFPGGGQGYHALGSSGSVRARITNGADAAFTAEIPLFSGRPFIHGGVLTGPDISVAIEKWNNNAAKELETFIIQPNANFPADVEFMFAVHSGRVFRMDPYGTTWKAVPLSSAVSISSFSNGRELHEYGGWNRYGNDDASGLMGEARLKAKLLPLGAYFMGQLIGAPGFLRQRLDIPNGDENTIRLFTFVKTPATFAPPSQEFNFGGGYTLFSQTLRKPNTTP